MVKEILQRYLDKVAHRVDMKEERELAEKYIKLFSEVEKEAQLEEAN